MYMGNTEIWDKYHQKFIIGVSLSEPHTSESMVRTSRLQIFPVRNRKAPYWLLNGMYVSFTKISYTLINTVLILYHMACATWVVTLDLWQALSDEQRWA